MIEFRSIALAAAACHSDRDVRPLPAPRRPIPTRPITMIVPAAAGGPSDTVARLVAEAMSATSASGW